MDTMKSKIYIVFCTLMIISLNIGSCFLATILSSDVIDAEQNAQRTDHSQSNGIPSVKSETENSDHLEILPRNDVPVLVNSFVNLVPEDSDKSNGARTCGSDSAPTSTSSSFAATEVEPIAKTELDIDKTIEAATHTLPSADRPAPSDIPSPGAGSPSETVILPDPLNKDSIEKVLDDTINEFLSAELNKTEDAPLETIQPNPTQDAAASQRVAAESDETLKDEVEPDSIEPIASIRDAVAEDANRTENVEAIVDKVPIELNLTVEENQIPVFSEWAQKRLEEVEKEGEQEVVNTSTQKKNASTATGKAPVLKLRGAKNYASPDCGAKIIASNSESSGTGYVLTSTKDEYLLSPCKSRIWFVVELCEAIQAEHIDLANYELFSSSPKNFSVAVSNRFPTRDWSNVGRFVAKDERYVQSFDLHPHLFGKYVRVDVHSHYNSEHFCPISLFRVYGTSEFEAFETENRQHPIEELDDDDDVDETIADKAKQSNIFKSASDAVMSIVDTVKKAAAFVKPQGNKTNTIDPTGSQQMHKDCWTPNFISMCEKCSQNLTHEMNALLRCKHQFLNRLLGIPLLRNSIRKSQFCANVVGIDMELNCGEQTPSSATNNSTERQLADLHAEYVLHLFPIRYVAALCNMLAAVDKKIPWNTTLPVTDDAATNVTIDKKAGATELLTSRKSKGAAQNVLESEKIPIPLDGAVREIDANVNAGSITLPTATTVPSSVETEQIKNDREAVIGAPVEVTVDPSPEANFGSQQIPPTPIPTIAPTEIVEATEGGQQNIFNVVAPTPAESETVVSEETAGSGMVAPTTEGNVNNWETIEDPLDVTTPSKPMDLNVGNDDTVAPPQFGQKLHSESVFLRLSNRVKALERNMSLSGQYLEELSRRYKRQVEELQQSFAKTLLNIEEQSRRNLERKQELFDQNQRLRADLEWLTQRVFSWRNVVLFCTCFFCIQIILFYVILRIYSRKYLSTVAAKAPTTETQCTVPEVANRRRKSGNTAGKVRRKSAEEKKNASNAVAALQRRPSTEALHITGTYEELLIKDSDSTDEITIHMNGNAAANDGQAKIRNRASNGKELAMHDDFVRIEDLKELYDRPALSDDYALYGPPPHLELEKELSGDEAICDTESTMDSSPNRNRKMVKTKLPKTNKGNERRLSSPSFFKTPFSSARNSKERSTGWEWHRSKKSQKSSQINSKKAKSESPNALRFNGISINSNLPNASAIAPKKFISREMARDSTESMRSLIGGSSIDSSERSKQGSFRRLLKKIF